jgi:hypothetical protein
MKLNENERKSVRKYLEFKRNRANIFMYNLIESLRPMSLFLVGIPLAGIFFLSIIGLLQFFKYNPIIWISVSIVIIFWYGCILHDLIVPYLKQNYKKLPKIED